MSLPVGRGVPDDENTLEQYLAADREACEFTYLTGEAVARGTLGAQGVSGRFAFAVSHHPLLRIESIGARPATFALTVGRSDTTLVYRERIRIAGNSTRLIDVALGLPLSAPDLRAVLTGCPGGWDGAVEAQRFGREWFSIRPGDDAPEAFLRRRGTGWSLSAMIRRGPEGAVLWGAEFYRDPRGWLERVRLFGGDDARGARRTFDLVVSFTNVHVDPLIGPETFTLNGMRATIEVTADAFQELRPARTDSLLRPR